MIKLRRLTDRIEGDPDNGEDIVKRYGLWGTAAEVEKKGRKIEVIKPDGSKEKFKTLQEAEVYLNDLVKM